MQLPKIVSWRPNLVVNLYLRNLAKTTKVNKNNRVWFWHGNCVNTLRHMTQMCLDQTKEPHIMMKNIQKGFTLIELNVRRHAVY